MLDIQTHRVLSSLQSLRDEWDALYRECGTSPAQTFEYVTSAFQHNFAAMRSSIQVISVRAGDQLVVVWPLVAVKGVVITRLLHPGCGSGEEYAAPLARPGPWCEPALAAALGALRNSADILEIRNVRHDHPLVRVLETPTSRLQSGSVFSPVIAACRDADWEGWLQTKSRSFRQQLRYGRRELEAKGQLSLSDVRDPDGIRLAVDWLFDRKVDFIRHQDIRKSWVLKHQNRTFFSDVIFSCPDIKIYVLCIENEIIAAGVCFDSIDTSEYYMTAYNEKYARYSPGNILLEELVKVAFERKKAFDFRITHDAYKLRWTDSLVQYHRYSLAFSRVGVIVHRATVFQPVWHRFKRSVKLTLNRVRKRCTPDVV